MLINIYMKYYEDILNGFQVTEQTRFCDGQKDRQTTMAKNNEPPHDKTNKMFCAPSEHSDQPVHPPSLISLRCPREESLVP